MLLLGGSFYTEYVCINFDFFQRILFLNDVDPDKWTDVLIRLGK